MEHLILRYTLEEKQEIERRWLEAKISQFREIRKKYEALDVQIQRIAHHLNIELPDA